LKSVSGMQCHATGQSDRCSPKWWSWQTRHLEGVVGKPVGVRVHLWHYVPRAARRVRQHGFLNLVRSPTINGFSTIFANYINKLSQLLLFLICFKPADVFVLLNNIQFLCWYEKPYDCIGIYFASINYSTRFAPST